MKKWILNIALAGLVVFFGFKIYQVWSRTDSAVQEEKQTSAPRLKPARRPSVRRPAPASSYEIISSKNLFTKERGESVASGPVVNPKTADDSRYAKNIALYGVVIRNEMRSALIRSGRSRRDKNGPTWVQVGDKIDQVTVVGIEADRIYVKEGTATFEVKLDERDHPGKRTQAKRPDKPNIITSKGQTQKPIKPAGKARTEPKPSREIKPSPTREED